MSTNRYFWPQELLDTWIVEEKITIEGEKLTILEEHRSYQLQSAVFFAEDVGDRSDAHKLVGRVKETAALEGMGAEHYMDSVILGDSAYRVVPGFTGAPEVKVVQALPSKPADISGAIALETGEQEEVDDRELLARFLIDNL